MDYGNVVCLRILHHKTKQKRIIFIINVVLHECVYIDKTTVK